MLTFTSQHDTVEAPPNAPPLVILPGFGNNSGDYSAPFGVAEAGLVAALQRRGFKAYVLPVERGDWFKVARMLLSLDFYRTRCTTEVGYSWYLMRVSGWQDAVLCSWIEFDA